MEIEVNCNNNWILLRANPTDEIQLPCRQPYETAMILENIFNAAFGVDMPLLDIRLYLINEDTRKLLGEW